MKCLLILLFLTVAIKADLPVHCLEHQIVGRWTLFRTSPKQTGPGLVSCGHDIPDHSENSYQAGWSDFKSAEDLDVELQSDGTVTPVGEPNIEGTWTMVYDEGFEITYKNIKYFAFSKYQPTGGKHAESLCDQTLIGWYSNLHNSERGCYRAQKSTKVDKQSSLDQESIVQPEYMKQDDLDKLGFIQLRRERNVNELKALSKEDHQKIVDKLNKQSGSWEATVYDHMIGKSFSEINSMAGRKRFFQGSKSEKKSKSFVQTSEDYKHYDAENLSDLPKEFNWKNYIGVARQQQQCGSCYAISTMEMLSARLKIRGENVNLSPQFSLNCNYYNQGCDGGYPFLVNKFASEEYLVPEEVEPYTGVDGTCNFEKTKSLSKVYQARNYRYLGGRYGKSTEREIMEEIKANGPVILNFEPVYAFMYYKSGIYHSTDAADWIEEHGEKPQWEKVDHSVLCYGWGEENGEKYWLLLNSWGPQWGENGSFRMRRGTDESAIESMGEAADPVTVHQQQSVSSLTTISTTINSSSDLLIEQNDDIFQFDNSFLSLAQQKNLRKNE